MFGEEKKKVNKGSCQKHLHLQQKTKQKHYGILGEAN
jgi:hypothetical protein